MGTPGTPGTPGMGMSANARPTSIGSAGADAQGAPPSAAAAGNAARAACSGARRHQRMASARTPAALAARPARETALGAFLSSLGSALCARSRLGAAGAFTPGLLDRLVGTESVKRFEIAQWVRYEGVDVRASHGLGIMIPSPEFEGLQGPISTIAEPSRGAVVFSARQPAKHQRRLGPFDALSHPVREPVALAVFALGRCQLPILAALWTEESCHATVILCRERNPTNRMAAVWKPREATTPAPWTTPSRRLPILHSTASSSIFYRHVTRVMCSVLHSSSSPGHCRLVYGSLRGQ